MTCSKVYWGFTGDIVTDRSVACMVGILLRNGADPTIASKSKSTPLHVACLLGYPETVSTLIDHGASVHVTDNSGVTVLHSCCTDGT